MIEASPTLITKTASFLVQLS